MFSTSDIGWVVGHSYIVYGPLIAGMATVMYEGTPLRPDPAVWWSIVEKYKVNVMFSAPTAIRVLKKQPAEYLTRCDISSLKHLFLAGEPLDEPTHRWISDALKLPVIDHYWQTETGWPMLSAVPGVERTPVKFGSPSFPVFGYDLRIFREDGSEAGANEKGIVGVVPPLPPGCLTTVWGDDERFVNTYFTLFRSPLVYSSFDWGIRDQDGYYFILGRTDDVINVAGHRLGTREIEEAVQAHPGIAEVAVVGVADQVKGQMPTAFAVVKDPSAAGEPRRRASTRAGSDAHRGRVARGDRPSRSRPLRVGVAEDPVRQAAAPIHPGARRRPRARRSHHHRGPVGPRANQGRPGTQMTTDGAVRGRDHLRHAREDPAAGARGARGLGRDPARRGRRRPARPGRAVGDRARARRARQHRRSVRSQPRRPSPHGRSAACPCTSATVTNSAAPRRAGWPRRTRPT